MALETALRHRLGRGNRATLEKLIERGLTDDLLPSSNEDIRLWTMLRENRNALAHGDPAASNYGPATARLTGRMLDAVNTLYESVDS